ncbi:Methylenetetrahydrofolate reductase [Fragilaria crotonensis]|nr:Methylenetetrahydrofolate reductase [Fragilaria crotonensis]
MGRILDTIVERRQKVNTVPGKPLYYSFEFFPPKTEAGLDNLLTRIDRMARRLDPLFIDVTWGSSGSTAVRSLAVASHAQRFGGVNVLLHLTCAGMTRDQLLNTLQQAKGAVFAIFWLFEVILPGARVLGNQEMSLEATAIGRST